MDAAANWNRLATKWMGISFGKDSFQVKMSERWIDQPQGHPAYGKKSAMVVGGPIDAALKTLK